MFRPFMDIIREEFDKEYFPDDGRKRKTLVEGLLYDCIYFCFQVLRSFWNKHCKIILVLLLPLIISYFWTDFFDGLFWKSLFKSIKQLQVSLILIWQKGIFHKRPVRNIEESLQNCLAMCTFIHFHTYTSISRNIRTKYTTLLRPAFHQYTNKIRSYTQYRVLWSPVLTNMIC